MYARASVATETVHAAWRTYRRWRRAWWGMLLGFLPSVLVLRGAASAFSLNEAVVFAFGLLWVILTLLCLRPRSEFRCPRCDELFHGWAMKGAYGLRFDVFNSWSRKCVHCGLRRYANP